MTPVQKTVSDEIACLQQQLLEAEARLKAINGQSQTFAKSQPELAAGIEEVGRAVNQARSTLEQLNRKLIEKKSGKRPANQSLSMIAKEAEIERKRLLAMMEALPVGVAILDAQGGNIRANRTFEQVWGSPRPQVDRVSGYTVFKAWWVDTGLPVQPEEWASAQAVQHGKTVTGQIMRIQRFDGTFAYILNSGAPIFDQNGQVTGCAVAIQDISDLKQQEEEIRQLNRTLQALNASNHAMLHATSEEQFLQEVCQVIIQDCGFAMVWIGYLADDWRQSVVPVASAGFEQGYLDSLKIALSDPERGSGPTGTAIRTGRPARCNNMLTDPRFVPWREAAMKRGYASSIVLPLLAGERAFGALNIYSREPQGFSDAEEKLLVEMAADLAYGISTLRLNARSVQAAEELRRSEEHYRNLFDNMTEGFALHEIICNKQGQPVDYRFLEVNSSFEHLTGIDRKQAIGRLASEVFPGLEPFWIQTYGQVALTGQPVQFDQFTQTLGRYYRVYAYQPAPRQFAVIFMDITEVRQAELQLSVVAKKYSTLFNTTMDGIWIHNMDGNILEVNDAYCQMSGYSREELINMQVSELEASETPKEIARHIKKLLKQGGHDSFESKHRRKDGSTFDVDITALYLDLEGGRIAIFVRDITIRKLAEGTLRRAHDELEQRVQERTQELNTANNELRAEVAERQKAQTELEMSLQELQVIEEELRNNNEMLIDAQKVLETERKRYQDLYEFAPDAYVVTDENGRILEANQNASTLLGIAMQNLYHKPLIVFVSREDHGIFTQMLTNLHTKKNTQYQDLRLSPRSGPEITAAVKIALAEGQGKRYTLRWTMRDISERKRAEETIRQNALRNAVLSEVSQSLAGASLDEKAILEMVAQTTSRLVGDSCIITLVSADGNWLEPAAVSHNKAEVLDMMTSLYGTTHNLVSDGLFGRVFQSTKPLLVKELSPAEAQANVPSQYKMYLERVGISSLMIVPLQVAEKTIGTLAIMRDRDSQPYTEDDQAMLEILAGRTGQAIYNARLYQDLQNSLRKELEVHDQLVQSEKFAAVGRLLASITHEINNPLQTIKNCLYLSQVDTQPGTPVYDALNIAVTETNRLSNLVAQLREIYRPPTQGLSHPVDLPLLIGEVQTLLASYLQEKHVSWLVTPPAAELSSHLKIDGVPDQLKQVFLNISLNAIDAMEPQGGKLMIDFVASKGAGLAGIRFRDTGPGLSPEVKQKLFEPFTTTKEKGLGLGLVICYDIIQKHNGRIDVESKPGEGAAFTIWLPTRRE